MKNTLLLLGAAAACVLSGCAGVTVRHTDIASGAHKPKAIYIRSYIAENAPFKGRHGDSVGERPIRRSLAPAEFSKALKEEMEKMAPAMVLDDNERPPTGWLVESNIEYVDAGSQELRASPFHIFGAGRSRIKIHVRITDVAGHYAATSEKDMSKGGVGAGNVIYEFDVAGGSGITGPRGQTYAPGLGSPEQFDYKNAAERIAYVLNLDPQGYGTRTIPSIIY